MQKELLNSEISWSAFYEQLLKKSKDNKVPLNATFELTPLCNFKCNMCYIRLSNEQLAKSGQLLSDSEWIELAKQTKKMGTLFLEITGGEIFTRPDFKNIYETIYDMGFLITLRTNGYLIDDHILEWLVDRKPYKIQITLYGASDETYKRVCEIENGFSVVTERLLKMKEAGLPVSIAMTATVDNQNDIYLLKKWADYYQFDLPVYGGLFTPFRNTGRTIDAKRVQFEDELEDKKYEIDGVLDMPPKKILSQVDGFSVCRTYGSRFTITWDGKLTVCNTVRSVYELPLKSSVKESFTRLYQKTDQVKRPEKCKDCLYFYFCSACPGRLYNETGSFDQISEYYCSQARKAYLKTVKYRNDRYSE